MRSLLNTQDEGLNTSQIEYTLGGDGGSTDSMKVIQLSEEDVRALQTALDAAKTSEAAFAEIRKTNQEAWTTYRALRDATGVKHGLIHAEASDDQCYLFGVAPQRTSL